MLQNPQYSAVLQATHLHSQGSAGVLFDLPSLTIPAGLTLVQGGEGRGKTTLLRLLAGELPQQVGSMVLDGIDLHSQDAAYHRAVAWFDPRTDAHDAQSSTVFFDHQSTRYPTWDANLLGDLVKILGLTAHVDKPLYMLSTGSKRKVWLAAAFASGAALTLLDEPFAALDGASIRAMLELLTEAASHPHRAWVLADYQAPGQVPLALTMDLGD
jgi:ABC-type multidrug transport system ATPase subunit